jgi:hypothetical protein
LLETENGERFSEHVGVEEDDDDDGGDDNDSVEAAGLQTDKTSC